MKRRLIQYLSLLLFFTVSIASKAQLPYLRISSINTFPDTIFQAQPFPVSIIVSNIGNTPFQGALQIAFQTDSSLGAINFLYFNSAPILITPGDTAVLINANGYTPDSSAFRTGNNVVVVWPYSVQSVTIDTFTLSTYFVNSPFSGVKENHFLQNVNIYPNPTSENIQIVSNDILIESVRIFDIKGILLYQEELNRIQRAMISLKELNSGMYFIEVIGKDNKRGIYRLVKY